MDVFNSALGYGYAILLGECVSALMSCGLEPGVGMLHTEEDGRPSLALDLMEEFRPYVVDQVVLRLSRQGGLTAEHGQRMYQSSGIFLNREGKQAVVGAYERRMLQVTRGASSGFAGSIRRHLYHQAQALAQFVLGNREDWVGLSWR
jgi:CRISPR-associated protein Cas1